MKPKKEITVAIKSIVSETTALFFSLFFLLAIFAVVLGLARAQYNPSAGTSWEKANDWIVFVHGWNMSEEYTEQFSETMFKRLYHAGYKGHFASFRWPTHEGKFTFNDSEYRAWKSGTSLKDFVAGLPGGTRKHIIAHSLGNIVVASALQQGMTLSTYIMMQAAVAGNCYGDAPEYQLFLDAENDLIVTAQSTRPNATPKNMNDLGYGLYLQSAIGNADRVVNCYNPDDYALSTGTILGINISWETNQIMFKPNQFAERKYAYKPLTPDTGECYLMRSLFDGNTLIGLICAPSPILTSLWLSSLAQGRKLLGRRIQMLLNIALTCKLSTNLVIKNLTTADNF